MPHYILHTAKTCDSTECRGGRGAEESATCSSKFRQGGSHWYMGLGEGWNDKSEFSVGTDTLAHRLCGVSLAGIFVFIRT
jgi:hypothetical protein